MKISSIHNVAVNLLFPPECIFCSERINVISSPSKINCVCDKCRPSYESKFSEVCPTCNKSVSTCLCGAKIGRREISPIAKCFYYKSQSDTKKDNSAVYAIKHVDDKRITKFFARELSISVLDMLKSEGIDPRECVFTFVPRRAKAKNKDGFDQGERLAKYTASACGRRRGYRSLFVRFKGKEQKKLSALAREKNLSDSIRMKPLIKKKIRGKAVCVIDDVVTSGATMRTAEKLLLLSGAERVVFACVARTKK